MRHPEHKTWCAVTHGYNTCTCALATEDDKPKHAARPPHPLTQIGKRNP